MHSFLKAFLVLMKLLSRFCICILFRYYAACSKIWEMKSCSEHRVWKLPLFSGKLKIWSTVCVFLLAVWC